MGLAFFWYKTETDLNISISGQLTSLKLDTISQLCSFYDKIELIGTKFLAQSHNKQDLCFTL